MSRDEKAAGRLITSDGSSVMRLRDGERHGEGGNPTGSRARGHEENTNKTEIHLIRNHVLMRYSIIAALFLKPVYISMSHDVVSTHANYPLFG